MVEVALDRPAHRLLETAPPFRRVAPFPEIGEVSQDKDANRVRVVKDERIVDLDVDAEQIEAGPFRKSDVVFNGLDISGGVDAVGIIRLVKRAADVDGFAVQRKRRGRSDVFGRLGLDAAHAEVAVDDVGFGLGPESEFQSV